MINVENAKKIFGYTNEHELIWLADMASKRKRIAEIGSFMGRSTRALADSTSGVIYAVDTWNGTPEDGHMKLLEGKPEDYLINEFRKNIGEDLLKGPEYKVRPLRMPSVEAADYLGRGCYKLQFDMIFIDAAHDYENVKADIKAWRPLLAPGGLFCGHDCEPGRGGVVKAVTEMVPNYKRIGIGTIWMET